MSLVEFGPNKSRFLSLSQIVNYALDMFVVSSQAFFYTNGNTSLSLALEKRKKKTTFTNKIRAKLNKLSFVVILAIIPIPISI